MMMTTQDWNSGYGTFEDVPLLQSDKSQVWPETKTNVISRILFLYCWRIIREGCNTTFTRDTVWNLDEPETTKEAYQRFVNEINKKSSTSLFMALCRTHRKFWAMSALLEIISSLSTFVIPMIVIMLIQLASSSRSEPVWHGYGYVLILFLALLVRSLTMHHQSHLMNKIGIRIRAALSACVYRKALKLSADSRREFSTGEIQNLISIDVCRFSEQCRQINLVWSGPFKLCLGIYFIQRAAGNACWAGFVVVFVLITVNLWASKFYSKFLTCQMIQKDERMKILSEMIKHIKLVKVFAWERALVSMIVRIRNTEIIYLRKAAYLAGFSRLTYASMTPLACLTIYAVFVLTNPGRAFTADVAFAVATVFSLIYIPMLMVPDSINAILSMRVSMTRLEKFFDAPEIKSYVNEGTDPGTIRTKNATLSWTKHGTGVLAGLNFRCEKAQLIAVIGQVGAGKSSLLSAILGEMYMTKGRIEVHNAWIFNDTLRSNILFGKEYDPVSYATLIESCALEPDLSMLMAGDLTDIGERGVNLSGGQKQRVSLARAVYQDRDIYLMDDPLSAVDVHVGKHLFDRVIGPNGMLKGKTRILVTHSLPYLPQCDLIMVLTNGRIVSVGSYAELYTHGKIQSYHPAMMQDCAEQGPVAHETCSLMAIDDSNETQVQSSSSSVRRESLYKQREASNQAKTADNRTDNCENESALAQSLWRGLMLYVKATGPSLLVFFLLIMSAFTCILTGTIWLQKWTDKNSLNESGIEDNWRHMSVYSALIGFEVLLEAAYCLAYALYATRAAQIIHERVFQTLVRAPMSFFDVTPTGRILSRLGKDMSIIDNEIPFILFQVLLFIVELSTVLITPIYANPVSAVVVIPSIAAFALMQNLYVKSSRQLRRLEAISRSPIYSRFQETLQGLESLRAYKKADEFCIIADRMVDENNRAQLSLLTMSRWLNINLDFLSGLVVGMGGLLAVMYMSNGYQSPGLIGLAISVLISLSNSLVWGSDASSTLATETVSLERVHEYTNIPSEASWTRENPRIQANWPSEGSIEFRNYSTRYRPDHPLVLKNLNLKIAGGEKLGIAGRTGSGKSTLASALFRLLEPSEGMVLIDSIDITQVGLQELRRRLTIIPQEPSLFSGSLRYNLDPFDQFSDEELWRALELCHMKKYVVDGLTDGLESRVEESGNNLSTGQRQLLCMARAILRRPKILVLDEATASVDHETDQLIQMTIRTQFAHCTILTIAHRVKTILDNDKVLILDNGRILEYGSIKDTLANPKSHFRRMVIDGDAHLGLPKFCA